MGEAIVPRRQGVSKQQHVADVLREHIAAGVYRPGQQLPAESELQVVFGYDRGTIRRGVAILRQAGLITAEHGRGTFVRERRLIRHDALSVLRTEYQHMQAGTVADRGLFELTTGVPVGAVDVAITYDTTIASVDLAEAFGTTEGAALLSRRYFFTVDGKPHQLTTSYLLKDMIDGTQLTDPANEAPGRGTMLQLRDIGVITDSATFSISARMPSPEEAAELNVAEGTPVILHRQRLLADDRTVSVADTVTPADRAVMELTLDLKQL